MSRTRYHRHHRHRKTLSELLQGEHATILGFLGRCPVNKRLASIGFTPGAVVGMARNFGSGPLIISVRGTNVALGRGEAAKIIVDTSADEK